MAIGFWQTLSTLPAAGAANTAGTRASMLPASGAGRFTLPANSLKQLGDQILLKASGIISAVITTPGSVTFDLAMATVAKLSSGVMPLNIVARTNTPWELEMLGTLTTQGTSAVLTWTGKWLSDAMINTALQATGPGPGGTMLPYSGTATGASTASGTFDSTISQLLDLYFTSTVGTGSCQLLQMNISILTATGF
jgi:hypothetical protein